MDWDKLLVIVTSFFLSAKLHVILALVVLDVVLAVAVALRTKAFEFRRLADFLSTMIVPYVLVYLVLYVIVHAVTEIENILGQGLDTVVFLVILASLAGSVYENFKTLGINMPRINDNREVKAG